MGKQVLWVIIRILAFALSENGESLQGFKK